MKIIKTLVVLLFIASIESCKQAEFHHYILRRSFIGLKYTFRNYADRDTNNLVFYEAYDSFSKRYKTIGIGEKGRIVNIMDCDKLNYPLKGGTESFYNKGRLIRYQSYDSMGYVNGPVFFYTKRGKTKYILEYQHGVFKRILYSNKKKIEYRDTIFLSPQFSPWNKDKS